MEKVLNCDIAKELLIILLNCDNEFLSKLPKEFIRDLSNLAADSQRDYYIDMSKPLTEQHISNECMSLLHDLYIKYAVDLNEM